MTGFAGVEIALMLFVVPVVTIGVLGLGAYLSKRPSPRVAAISVATVILTLLGGSPQHEVPKNSVQVSSPNGEQRSLTLDDSSLVQLNQNSNIEIHAGERARQVYLPRGEARFTVARDVKRPFTVRTPHALVRVLGTVFNVRAGETGTAVAVLEGKVEVVGGSDLASGSSLFGSPRSQVVLREGQAVTVMPNGAVMISATGIDANANGWPANAWPKIEVQFQDQPLSQVVDTFNRYHKQPLRIADERVANLRIDGAFNAYDRETLVDYLSTWLPVNVSKAPDGSDVLSWDERPDDESAQ